MLLIQRANRRRNPRFLGCVTLKLFTLLISFAEIFCLFRPKPGYTASNPGRRIPHGRACSNWPAIRKSVASSPVGKASRTFSSSQREGPASFRCRPFLHWLAHDRFGGSRRTRSRSTWCHIDYGSKKPLLSICPMILGIDDI
jgi:hypothetical protein